MLQRMDTAMVLRDIIEQYMALRGVRGHSRGCHCCGSPDGKVSCKSFEKLVDDAAREIYGMRVPESYE